MFKNLVEWEESLWSTLVERVAERHPGYFWREEALRGLALDAWLLDNWPKYLTFSYWYYLFHDLEGSEWWGSDRYSNWVNIPQWGEIRYLFKRWDAKEKRYRWEFNPKWVWIQLTEETKGNRLICRVKGHPKGEIYYNPGGYEPDHRCQTCGESIG